MPHAPITHLRRIAEIYFREEDRAAYLADCLDASTVEGETYRMTDEAFAQLRKKWAPKRIGLGRDIAMDHLPCSGCSGGNPIKAIKGAKTAAEAQNAEADL